MFVSIIRMSRRITGAGITPPTILVRPLPWETTRVELLDYFQRFGDVQRVHLPYNRETGFSKGVAFIEFANETSVREVLKKEDHVIDDRKVTVKRTDQPDEKASMDNTVQQAMALEESESMPAPIRIRRTRTTTSSSPKTILEAYEAVAKMQPDIKFQAGDRHEVKDKRDWEQVSDSFRIDDKGLDVEFLLKEEKADKEESDSKKE